MEAQQPLELGSYLRRLGGGGGSTHYPSDLPSNFRYDIFCHKLYFGEEKIQYFSLEK